MKSVQRFKSIYFPDYRSANTKAKSFVLAFGENQHDAYKSIAKLGSSEVRHLLGTDSYNELEQRAQQEGLHVNTYCLWYLQKSIVTKQSSTITKNTQGIQELSALLGKVIEADCLDAMHRIPSKSIDLILCDLPYGTTQNRWDSVIPLDQLWDHYNRIVKDDGVALLTGQGLFTARLMLSNEKSFKYKLVWVKSKPTNFLNAKKQPLRKHEDICVFYKSQPTYFPQMTAGDPYNKGFRKNQLTGSYGDFKSVEVKSSGERYPTDVIYFKTAESEGEVVHPTQKPVELGRYLIRTFSKKGDVVLDNACGSGSFLVSAVLEDRKFIGIEKNEESYIFKDRRADYVAIAKERVKEATVQFDLEQKIQKLF